MVWLWDGVVWCCFMLLGFLYCGLVFSDLFLYGIVGWDVVWCGVVLCGMVLCWSNIVLASPLTLHCTSLFQDWGDQ